jgi:hypothetical protein
MHCAYMVPNRSELLENEIVVIQGWFHVERAHGANDSLKAAFMNMWGKWTITHEYTAGSGGTKLCGWRGALPEDLLVYLQRKFFVSEEVEKVGVI